MNYLKNLSHVPVTLAQRFQKDIRLLARAGQKMFRHYFFHPLETSHWKRIQSNESSKKQMARIEKNSLERLNDHTIAPLCKRMICTAMEEGLSDLGDCSIFFLEKMVSHPKVSYAEESREFIGIIRPSLEEFINGYKQRSTHIFDRKLQNLTKDELRDALVPVELGKGHKVVMLEQEAVSLFNRIKIANSNNDIPRCKKLIATYFINFIDKEANSNNEVEKLVEAFERSQPGFRKDLNNMIAVDLYYQIFRGIADNKLANTIRAIRKYAFFFQGNSEALFFYDIDNLEQKLYEIIKKKDLWDELSKN